MCALLALIVVFAYVDDAKSQDFCKLDLSNPGTQFCFDPRSVDGLRRCNTYEPEDVIVRPACSAHNRNSNYSLIPMRCVNGNWENVGGCESVRAPAKVQVIGSECTWKGAKGTCVNIYRCLSAAEHIYKKERPPKCEYDGDEPVICCTDCSLVNDTRRILYNTQLGFLYKNGRKAHDKCIDYINELDYPCSTDGVTEIEWTLDKEKNCYNAVEIGNVTPLEVSSADRSEFPHMALLGYGPDVLSLRWLCSGSLISHTFILTTAHCVTSPIVGPASHVAFGIPDRSALPDLEQIYGVKSTILHPDYQPNTIFNDIALLELKTPVSYNDVRPACLHVDGELDDKATTVTSASLLLNEKDSAEVWIRAVEQVKLKDEECKLQYSKWYNSTTQICYGSLEGSRETCKGDSGGPLQSKEHYPQHCVFTVLGVMTYSKQCKDKLTSGVYTRVQYYVPWIESIVWP